VLNAANEVAVQAFLDSAIGFGTIARMVEAVLAAMSFTEADSLEAVAAADASARELASRLI
jgi:1-deoxy-D-xylulose-5-phosphate reductoisomerase